MVKRRDPQRTGQGRNQMDEQYNEQVEAFAAGADGASTQNLQRTAPRNYKTINVRFNQYEFEQLERAAQKSGRSKLDYLRRAMLEQAEIDLGRKSH